MTVIKAASSITKPLAVEPLPSNIYSLIDTHTHFDAPIFDKDRLKQAQQAYHHGVRHLVLVGYLFRHFDRLYSTQQALQSETTSVSVANIEPVKSSAQYPQVHIALGLHPYYIEQHTDEHLSLMAAMLNKQRPLAIGEIGLDTFTTALKEPESLAKQQRFFNAQLDMAVSHQLPVMLHIRKAHAEALAILKAHRYNAHQLGGIAHSFSGGEQEAKAFVKLGFKLGVTGQITNPNAKKLRRAIQAAVDQYGIECLVIETDCPDMTPISCQTSASEQQASTCSSSPFAVESSSQQAQDLDSEWQRAEGYDRNVPANLPWIVSSLSELLAVEPQPLVQQLWHNSCEALQTKWTY